jgi:hypothetical protein
VLFVSLVALGVPASTPLAAALVLICPLMMVFMMSGMHGGHGAERRAPTPGIQRPRPATHHRPPLVPAEIR